MQLAFYTSDETFIRLISGLSFASEPLITDDSDELLSWLESEDVYGVFIDYEGQEKKAEKINKKLVKEFELKRVYVASSDEDAGALKKHQLGNHAADGYLVRPLTAMAIHNTIHDFEMADHLMEHGTQVGFNLASLKGAPEDDGFVEMTPVNTIVRETIDSHSLQGDASFNREDPIHISLQKKFDEVFDEKEPEKEPELMLHDETDSFSDDSEMTKPAEEGGITLDLGSEDDEEDSGGIGLDLGSADEDSGDIGLDLGSAEEESNDVGLEFGSVEEDSGDIGLDLGSAEEDSGGIDLEFGNDEAVPEEVTAEASEPDSGLSFQLDALEQPELEQNLENDMSDSSDFDEPTDPTVLLGSIDKDQLQSSDEQAPVDGAEGLSLDLGEPSEVDGLELSSAQEDSSDVPEDATAQTEIAGLSFDMGEDASMELELSSGADPEPVAADQASDEGGIDFNVGNDDDLSFDIGDQATSDDAPLDDGGVLELSGGGSSGISLDEAPSDGMDLEFSDNVSEGAETFSEVHMDNGDSEGFIMPSESIDSGDVAFDSAEDLTSESNDELLMPNVEIDSGDVELSQEAAPLDAAPVDPTMTETVTHVEENAGGGSHNRFSAQTGQSEPSSNQSYPVMSEYQEEEMLRHQEMLRQLREERDSLLASIDGYKSQAEYATRENLSLKSELEEMRIEMSILKKRHLNEFEEVREKMKLAEEKKIIFEEKAKNIKGDFERLSQKVKVDFNQVRRRERELESQLELVKMDSQAQVESRDRKILELKRKIDALEFNIENVSIREQKSKNDKTKLEDKLDKIMKTLRGSIEMLEDTDELGNVVSKIDDKKL